MDLEKALTDIKEWKSGNKKFKTTIMEKPGKRTELSASEPELNILEQRRKAFNAFRRDIGATQEEIAKAVHVSTRTVEGWEMGRRKIPETVLVLTELMREFPNVRKRLLPAENKNRNMDRVQTKKRAPLKPKKTSKNV